MNDFENAYFFLLPCIKVYAAVNCITEFDHVTKIKNFN